MSFYMPWLDDEYREHMAQQINKKGEKNMSENSVNHPSHYADGRRYEPIDVIKDWNLNFCLGNAVKYISRAGRKDPAKFIEDLNKAIWYIQYEIDSITKEENNENT